MKPQHYRRKVMRRERRASPRTAAQKVSMLQQLREARPVRFFLATEVAQLTGSTLQP